MQGKCLDITLAQSVSKAKGLYYSDAVADWPLKQMTFQLFLTPPRVTRPAEVKAILESSRFHC